jgi:hypothetical protein
LTKRPLRIRSTMTTHPNLTKHSQRMPPRLRKEVRRRRKVGSYSKTK